MNRRRFLLGLTTGLVAAPAIVRVSSLMTLPAPPKLIVPSKWAMDGWTTIKTNIQFKISVEVDDDRLQAWIESVEKARTDTLQQGLSPDELRNMPQDFIRIHVDEPTRLAA